jgi:hypothetical protein
MQLMKKTDLTGKRFGKLTAISQGEYKGKNTTWKCMCDCGNEREYLTYNLTSGKSNSCGCARIETLKKVMTKHGGRQTRLYQIFKGMSQRCYNENSPAYQYYGGKGVFICDEWKNDFAVFREWAEGNGYTESMSIDRINPNGNYCPENCRWTSMQKQQNNKLNSAFIIINEEKLTIAEWAENNKTNKATLYSKFYRLFDQLGLSRSEIIEISIKHK